MNLNELFEIQDKLDKHIVKEKGLEGQDLLDNKILALQVELGELANEWRGFKFWSNDQEPKKVKNVYRECWSCEGTGIDELETERHYKTVTCEICEGEGDVGIAYTRNPLLEEYVDCLHFILSIGLEIGCTPEAVDLISKEVDRDITKQFIGLFDIVSAVRHNAKNFEKNKSEDSYLYKSYHKMFSIFLGLGQMLGFTTEQIEQSYLEKNRINHERQANGY